MKTILVAAAIALAPILVVAGGMQAPAQPQAAQVAGHPVMPSPLFLTRQSDFSVFFKPGVSAELQRQALQILRENYPDLEQGATLAALQQ
jgi:hypothetical protein